MMPAGNGQGYVGLQINRQTPEIVESNCDLCHKSILVVAGAGALPRHGTCGLAIQLHEDLERQGVDRCVQRTVCGLATAIVCLLVPTLIIHNAIF